jgi:hypothetical protein
MRFTRKDSALTGEFAARDASWFARPNVDSVKMLHAVTKDGLACSVGIPLDVESGAFQDANGLAERRICKRTACMREWRRQQKAELCHCGAYRMRGEACRVCDEDADARCICVEPPPTK